MDMEVLMTLLTITVVLLSIVIIALLVAMTIVLVKIQKLIRHVDAVMANVASASDWLSPLKLFSHIGRLFRK